MDIPVCQTIIDQTGLSLSTGFYLEVILNPKIDVIIDLKREECFQEPYIPRLLFECMKKDSALCGDEERRNQ